MRINLLISLEKIRNPNVFRCFKGDMKVIIKSIYTQILNKIFGVTLSILINQERIFVKVVFDSLIKHMPNAAVNYENCRFVQ